MALIGLVLHLNMFLGPNVNLECFMLGQHSAECIIPTGAQARRLLEVLGRADSSFEQPLSKQDGTHAACLAALIKSLCFKLDPKSRT